MDYSVFFFFCVIFALVGFITTKIWGFDIYKIYSDFGSVIVLVPLLALIFYRPESAKESVDLLSGAMTSFANALPGIIIGDVAGSLVAEFTEFFR